MGRPDIRSRARTALQGLSSKPFHRTLNIPEKHDPAVKPSTKQQKRSAKRAELLLRASDSSKATGRQSAGIKKKRRPARKLAGVDAAGLGALASALDDAAAEHGELGNLRIKAGNTQTKRTVLAPNTSVKSVKGMQRKKEQINRLEAQRFSRNLAILNTANVPVTPTEPEQDARTVDATRSKRWQALRQHIATSMGNS